MIVKTDYCLWIVCSTILSTSSRTQPRGSAGHSTRRRAPSLFIVAGYICNYGSNHRSL